MLTLIERSLTNQFRIEILSFRFNLKGTDNKACASNIEIFYIELKYLILSFFLEIWEKEDFKTNWKVIYFRGIKITNAFIRIYYSESVNRNISLYNGKKNQKVLSKLMFDAELFVGIHISLFHRSL